MSDKGAQFTAWFSVRPITVSRVELEEARRLGPLGLWERMWLDVIDAERRSQSTPWWLFQ